jgi:hypothetical protein
MNMAAFVSLEDISAALPPYTEEIISVEMKPAAARGIPGSKMTSPKLCAIITATLR